MVTSFGPRFAALFPVRVSLLSEELTGRDGVGMLEVVGGNGTPADVGQPQPRSGRLSTERAGLTARRAG